MAQKYHTITEYSVSPLTISPLAVNFEDANKLDPDEALQNVGLHLRSKLFDIQIIYQQNIWEETMICLIF